MEGDAFRDFVGKLEGLLSIPHLHAVGGKQNLLALEHALALNADSRVGARVGEAVARRIFTRADCSVLRGCATEPHTVLDENVATRINIDSLVDDN